MGATALVGAIERLLRREADVAVGVMFAIAGMIGAPAGVTVRRHTDDAVLLALFSTLMIVVAIRMFASARQQPPMTNARSARRTALMVLVAVATGVLSGVFGVGGGFMIVPALMLFGGVPIHRAVATSLVAVSLISASGVASQVVGKQPLSWTITGLFVAGGLIGMFAGNAVSRRIAPGAMQKTFAVVIVLVAVFNGVATFLWHR